MNQEPIQFDKTIRIDTKKEILEFIANDGLENIKFQNTNLFKKQPELTVDAYEFRSGSLWGYISFGQNEKTKKWFIKSFHLSDKHNRVMMNALDKLKLQLPGGEK